MRSRFITGERAGNFFLKGLTMATFQGSLKIRRTALASLALSAILFSGCKTPATSVSKAKDEGTEAPTINGKGSFPPWAYDGGPDVSTEMGRSLVDLNSQIPFFPGISQAVYGDQMFRPAFGPIPWRMMQKPNSVKILFIGQDGTHIAEAAERPATAGFGGRAQDLAKYFGVSSSAAFINTFAFTIRWQYGAFDTPIVNMKGPNGKPQINFGSFTGNPVWLVSQDQDSPIVKWRNRLIEWIIRNNKDSLKMIVLFGGGARDAAGSFIVSKGGTVGTKYSEAELANIQVPEFDLLGAGSNKQTSVPFATDGSDLLAKFAGTTPDYTKPEVVTAMHENFKKAFNANPDQFMSQMVFSHGGLHGSGVLNPAQIGGYDIDRKMQINGQTTISLKGLQIAPDLVIDHDILITQLPHPTALSMMAANEASVAVDGGVVAFSKYVAAGWKIDADAGFANSFVNRRVTKAPAAVGYSDTSVTIESDQGFPAEGALLIEGTATYNGKKIPMSEIVTYKGHAGGTTIEGIERRQMGTKPPAGAPVSAKLPFDPGATVVTSPYLYNRGDMGTEYYDFGAPNSRMVNVSTASRSGANVIIFGTRDKANFDKNKIQAMTKAMPATMPDGREMWIAKPISDRRTVFDPGPGEKYARIMKQSLPTDDAFIKKHEVNGDYGHYRGTFNNPQVIIVADPDGFDDLITARALTGSRGQYLQGLMNDLGVNDKYLVIKTAPYSLDESDPADWTEVFQKTSGYRDAVLGALMQDAKPKMIIADGQWAAQEVARIVQNSTVPVVVLQRQPGAKDAGIVAAADNIKKVPGFEGATITGKIADIPRSHLSYYARVWEGTSGDRVITSTDPQYRGQAFAEVAPQWAYSQKFEMSASDTQGTQTLLEKIEQGKLRRGGEKVTAFASRLQGAQTPVPEAAPSVDASNVPTDADMAPTSASPMVDMGTSTTPL